MLRFNAVGVTQNIVHPFGDKVRVYEWNLVSGETGDAVAIPDLADVTIQVSGTFGAAITVEGSLDPAAAVYAPLNDVSKTAISLTAAGVVTVLENTYWVRPVAGAVTAVRVLLLAHL